MCFAPQRSALFRHLNFQNWSERAVFLAFSLANVRRATTACNFSSLIWPDGSAHAALASLLFDPPEPQIIGKNTVFRDFPTFSRACTFFLLTLSVLWSSLFFSSLLFSSLLFSSLLFSSLLYSSAPPLLFICPYCRKFDFEPSISTIGNILLNKHYSYQHIYSHHSMSQSERIEHTLKFGDSNTSMEN